MTTNQINYQKMLEDKRHNKAVESETRKQNLRDIELREKQIQSNYDITNLQLAHSRNVLDETKRHNLAQEEKDLMYATRMLDETNRHNVVQEQISRDSLKLTERQINNNFAIGMANVDVAKTQAAELQRHNLQAEIELNRHNTAMELNDATKIEQDYQLSQQRNAETQRHNVQSSLLQYTTIKEQNRHNLAVEAETQRHNVQNSLLQYNTMKEQNRHNLVTENVSNRAQVTNTLTNISEQANKWFKTFSSR